MIPPDLIPVLRAIKEGDKSRARRLLRDLLKAHPTAEAWYLASQVTESTQHEMDCLKRALALDPYHVEARRRMSQLETAAPAAPVEATATPSTQAGPESVAQRQRRQLAPDVVKPQKLDTMTIASILDDNEAQPARRTRRRRRRGTWFYIGIASAILLSLASSYFVLTLLGSSLPGQVLGVVTGQQPVTEIDGVPIEEVEDAVLHVEPSNTRSLRPGNPISDALTAGVSHDYEFQAQSGEEIVIAIQFFSLSAQSVGSNVALFDADGQEATRRCRRETIIDANSGAAFVCSIHAGGVWTLRILGIDGESTGAYVITMDRFD